MKGYIRPGITRGVVLARPSQNKLIWFSDAMLLFVVEWRQNATLCFLSSSSCFQLSSRFEISFDLIKLLIKPCFNKVTCKIIPSQ